VLLAQVQVQVQVLLAVKLEGSKLVALELEFCFQRVESWHSVLDAP